MNRHYGKNTTGMMLVSLLSVEDNNILPKWYEETTGLCFDCPDDGDLHISSQPTCSLFPFMGVGTRLGIIVHMLMGCHTFFCLSAPPITLQITLLHPCVSFWGTNYKNALQQVLCKL